MHHACGICEWPVTIYLPNSNIYLLQILFYYFHYNTVYSVCCRYTSCNLKQKQGSNCLLSVRRKWFLFIHIVPGKIVDFWNSDFLKKSQLDLPSAWIFFLYLLLCMNFFSWHYPLHEFFFFFVDKTNRNISLSESSAIFSASFLEERVALSVGHPRGTHSRYVIDCCLIPLGICVS